MLTKQQKQDITLMLENIPVFMLEKIAESYEEAVEEQELDEQEKAVLYFSINVIRKITK